MQIGSVLETASSATPWSQKINQMKWGRFGNKLLIITPYNIVPGSETYRLLSVLDTCFILDKNMVTSSARSATLEDTSWAWLHLGSWKLPDSQFCSKSKTEPKCSRHRTKLGGGDTAQKKCIPGGWGHRTYFLNRVPIGRGDTAHTFWTEGQ